MRSSAAEVSDANARSGLEADPAAEDGGRSASERRRRRKNQWRVDTSFARLSTRPGGRREGDASPARWGRDGIILLNVDGLRRSHFRRTLIVVTAVLTPMSCHRDN